jgi:hypothetical protein
MDGSDQKRGVVGGRSRSRGVVEGEEREGRCRIFSTAALQLAKRSGDNEDLLSLRVGRSDIGGDGDEPFVGESGWEVCFASERNEKHQYELKGDDQARRDDCEVVEIDRGTK